MGSTIQDQQPNDYDLMRQGFNNATGVGNSIENQMQADALKRRRQRYSGEESDEMPQTHSQGNQSQY
jgi:hypothetical protein